MIIYIDDCFDIFLIDFKLRYIIIKIVKLGNGYLNGDWVLMQ